MSDTAPEIELPEPLKACLLQCPTLPSLPGVVLKVIDASKDPDIGLAEVSEIIRTDPALSAKMLRIANSPLYSLRRTIHNLREALTLLGLNASLTIALSFSLIKSLKNNINQPFIHESYWKRSILSATIAKHMGFKLGLSNIEDIFLTSLLQDIGILVLQCTHPGLYNDTADHYMPHSARMEVEEAQIEANHAAVGAWILQSWRLPEKLYNSVLNSHSLETSLVLPNNDQLFQQCISFSGHLADIWIDEDQDQLLIENLELTKKILGLNDSEYNEFINDISNILPEVSELFEITLSDNFTRDRVLDHARELLLQRNLQFIKQSEQDRRQIEAMTEKHRDLEEEARRDPLTHVYNRKYFEDLLEEEYENANLNRWPLSLAFIDIDNFKTINDTLGHTAGDLILKELTGFISDHIRQTDILSRFGGDEFILLLPGSTNQEAFNMLGRLIKNLRNNFKPVIDENSYAVSVSIGLATHMDTNNFLNKESLINAADEALYRVKQAGRDNIMTY